METIDPKTIPALYRELGMRPMREKWYHLNFCNQPCGCLVGVLLVKAAGTKEAEDVIYASSAARSLGCSIRMVNGMIDGFDGDHPDGVSYGRSLDSDYADGYRIGQESWNALVAEGMVA